MNTSSHSESANIPPSEKGLVGVDKDFWELFVRNLPAMVCLMGEDARCLYCNDAWLNFRGQALEKELGLGWIEGIHPDDAKSLLQNFQSETPSSLPLDVQYRMQASDGAYRWLGTKIAPCPSRQGQVYGVRYVTVSYDITVQKERLNQLQTQNRLIDKSPNVIFICDLGGKVEFINHNGCRLLGCQPEQLIGQPIHDLDWGVKSADVLDECIATVCKGGEWQGELSGTTPEGKTFFVSGVISPVTDRKERPIRLVGILNDITSLKQTKLSEDRNHLLIDGVTTSALRFLETNDLKEMTQNLLDRCIETFQAATGLFFVHDPDGDIRLLSMSGKVAVPWATDETFSLETRSADMLSGTTHLLLSPMLERKSFKTNGDDEKSQSRLKLSEAELPFRSFLGVPLVVAETVVGMIALIDKPGGFDNQDKKDLESFSKTAALAVQNAQSELARVKALDELRVTQKFEAIGKLAGGIAHDFNNLLTVINGYSELLLQKVGDENNKRALELINESGEKAAELTRQLLAFSRQQIMEPKVLCLNHLIRNLNKILRRLIREDIEIKLNLSDHLDLVKADPSQMEQILINLIVNARDAMPHGGQIEISTADVTIDRRFVMNNPGAQKGRYVRMGIRDTGTGMSEEVRAKIFEPFFTTKEQGSGTGLGLSTVYGIVKQSQGYIKVISAPEQGTTFQIFLPRAVESATDLAPDAHHKPQRGMGTILVVEDEESVLTLVSQALTAYGYSVLEAAKPSEALKIFEAKADEIDLLLTDMVMPEMQGTDLVDFLEKQKSEMKILFMSGYSQFHDGTIQKSRENISFIQKPFSPQVLVSKVQSMLE